LESNTVFDHKWKKISNIANDALRNAQHTSMKMNYRSSNPDFDRQKFTQMFHYEQPVRTQEDFDSEDML